VDNGGPWGSSGNDLPPDLALWLIGLGIDVHWNGPHSPQQKRDGGAVPGDGQALGRAGRCATPEQSQERPREMDDVQRERYPSTEGRSRAEAFPGLKHSGRRYGAKGEARQWDHQRVLEHLSGYVLTRKVGKNGDAWTYHRPHYVGATHRGKTVFVWSIRTPASGCSWTTKVRSCGASPRKNCGRSGSGA